MQCFDRDVFTRQDGSIDAFGLVHPEQIIDAGVGKRIGFRIARQLLAGCERFPDGLIEVNNSPSFVDDVAQLRVHLCLHGREDNFRGKRAFGVGCCDNH